MKTFFLSSFLICFTLCLHAQWVEVASVPDDFRSHHSFGFGIDDIGYIVSGTDMNTSDPTNRFYSYDPSTDTWTQKEDFPGPARSFGIGDVYEGKAYFGFGLADNVFNDLWVFDPSTDEWEELPSCPCDPRWHPAFTITNNKIIVGMGGSQTGNRNDFFMYDIETQEWTQIATYPGVVRHHPYQFSIGDFHYAGFGHGQSIYKDWNRYDAATDTWEKMADLPGESRVAGTQFSFNGKGYVLSGDGADHRSMETGEFWEYDPASDSWTELTAHPGTSRWAPASFILNNEVYIVNGLTELPDLGYVSVDEVYKFALADPANVIDVDLEYEMYPNPVSEVLQIKTSIVFGKNDRIVVMDNTGKIVLSLPAQYDINLGEIPSGVYHLTLHTEKASTTKKFVKL